MVGYGPKFTGVGIDCGLMLVYSLCFTSTGWSEKDLKTGCFDLILIYKQQKCEDVNLQ